MKRTVNIASILLIVLSGVIFVYLFRAANTASASNASANALAFAAFPINEPRLINFDVNSEALADRSPREKLDQSRDWLLYAVLSESGKSVKDLSEMLYDLPATRSGYMHHVGNFEYGETRSRFIGDGQVVAVIPAGDTKERIDQLAQVADEHRKNTGEVPASILVFDYQLNADDDRQISSGEITRRDALEGKTLFTPEYGYYESRIKSLDDLKGFMQQVDDLVFAQLEGETLKVGGRKIQGRAYGRISVEEVAAIWQSENKLSGSHEGSGFSLDPTYRFDHVKTYFNQALAPEFEPYSDLDTSDDWMSNWPFSTRSKPRASVTAEDVREALDNCEIGSLFKWIDDQRSAYPEVKALDTLQEYIATKYGLQKARYDGDLKGTQVGMILFYTDLVAKLWGFDYKESAPREIDGFKSQLEIRRTQISPVFKDEMDNTRWGRLWFGPNRSGYAAIPKDNSLVFARSATQLFAKSSSDVGLENEVEPNVAVASFINWWDDHYEEVARYEPQYERLNQIMKWSLVITWLNNASEGNRIGFLDDSSMVNRSHRFPEWVKQQPDLRFNKWSADMFLPANIKCVSTEALPLLQSVRYARLGGEGKNWYLIGGVSLSRKQLFAERTFLTAESNVASLARRSNLNGAVSNESGLEMVAGASYKFQPLTPNRMAVTLTPKPEAALRTNYGTLETSKFEAVLASERNGLSVATKYGETGIGNLSVSRTGSGFKIGWQSREVDLSQSLARKLSTSTTPENLLAQDPNIESAISLSNGNGYLIKLSGADRWTRLSFKTKSFEPEGNWEATIGGLESSTKPVKLAWYDQARARAEIGEGYLLLSSEGAPSGSNLLKISDNVRATSGKQITILNGEQKIDAVFDAQTKSVLVKYRDLPEALQKNPVELQRAVSKMNVAQLQRDGILRITDATPFESRLARDFTNRDFSSLSKKLTESPSEFKSALENNLKQELQLSDALVSNRNYISAQQKLDGLIDIYGPRPQLVIRKGIAQIRGGQMKSAAAYFNDQVSGLQSGPRRLFFDEVNLRLRSSAGPGEPVVEFVDTGSAFSSRVNIQSLPQGSKMASVEDIGSGTFYIQDSGRLRNLDWYADFQGSLREAVSGEFADVIKLPPGGPGDYVPTEIYVGDTGRLLSSPHKTTTRYNLKVPARITMSNPCPDDDQNDRNGNRCSDTYLVVDRGN